MNTRPHGQNCVQGKPCSKCYKRDYYKDYRRDKLDIVRAAERKYDTNNSEKRREYRQKNIRKQYERARDWRLKNPGKARAHTAKRRAALLQATPPWADLNAIQQVYMGCPAGHEVDHIIPLQGKTVCGLHVASNLQYLPMSANRSKGNKHAA